MDEKKSKRQIQEILKTENLWREKPRRIGTSFKKARRRQLERGSLKKRPTTKCTVRYKNGELFAIYFIHKSRVWTKYYEQLTCTQYLFTNKVFGLRLL